MVIFSFFSGVGMLDLGFEEAGYNIVLINEFNQDFMNSYIYARRNRISQPPRFGYHVGDINMFLQEQQRDYLHRSINTLRSEGETIVFIGGPPCPDFSIGGLNRGRDGANGRLARSYIDMILEFRPDIFLFENVKGLVKTKRHREYFDELKGLLQNNNYCLSEALLNALSYGVAQDRDRILLLGVERQSALANENMHCSISFEFPWNLNLPYNANEVKLLPWPDTTLFRENSRRIFRYDVPAELTVEYWFRKNNVNHHPNRNDIFNVKSGLQKMLEISEGDTSRKSFKRLHRWRFSPTAAYGNNEVHLHPYRIRRLSVAETMAIQSLPQWFELPAGVTLSRKFKMVGNGVPFLMANTIARQIRQYFGEDLK